MSAVRTASNTNAPLQPPEPVDAPSDRLRPARFDELAGAFIRADYGGKHAEAFDAWLVRKGYA